jgi:hypothetical protein
VDLPAALVADATAFPAVDAVLTAADGRTYLFSDDAFVVFDAKRRWWSPPQRLAELWPSLPFDAVDAAFVGIDGNTYVFRGDRYARLSAAGRTHLDDRFPAPTRSFWGRVDNGIAQTGRVDATLVLEVDEPVDGGTRTRTYTYLFSGDQYVRYADHDYSRVEDGYPRALGSLVEEPRFANLFADLSGGIDAAFADRHTIVLVSGPTCHLVTDTLYRRRTDLPVSGLRGAFVEDGAVLVEDAQGWRRNGGGGDDRDQRVAQGRGRVHPGQHRFLARPTTVPVLPALEQLRVTRPARGRALPPWDRIDAGFPNADGSATWFDNGHGRYAVVDAAGAVQEEGPIPERWGRVGNAFTVTGKVDAGLERDGMAYLFSGPQYVRISGADLATADQGYPRRIADNTDGLPRWDRIDAAFRGLDGVEYYFSTDLGVVSSGDLADVRPNFERWGRRTANDAQGTSFGSGAIEAALVRGAHTFLVSGGEYVRYTGPSYGVVDEGYPRPLDHNPDDLPAEVTAAASLRGASYFFEDEPPVFVVVEPDGATWTGQTNELGAGPTCSLTQWVAATQSSWAAGKGCSGASR